MKPEGHPKYYPNAKIICACGNTWTTGSVRPEIRTDMCYKCHPFYTGEQRIVDTEGQVDRFYKKLEARTQHQVAAAAREAARVSTSQAIASLGLGERIEAALATAGITSIAEAVEKVGQGDEFMLAIDGLGRKGLIDLKKRLRSRGFLTEETAAA